MRRSATTTNLGRFYATGFSCRESERAGICTRRLAIFILIEQLLSDQIYITNDIEFNDSQLGMLLYGTNAVGKTSCIRAIGMIIIMAQAGLFVPATTFTYSIYNKLFTRILGNDNLFKGLSTFAVEMIELRSILKMADNNSLVLGDELCSGTESTSALSIFTAGVK